jgi:hypothetical protein
LGIVRNTELLIFGVPVKPKFMFRDTYLICGIIFCICIVAIIFGIKILRESRMNEHEMDRKKPGNKAPGRK